MTNAFYFYQEIQTTFLLELLVSPISKQPVKLPTFSAAYQYQDFTFTVVEGIDEFDDLICHP